MSDKKTNPLDYQNSDLSLVTITNTLEVIVTDSKTQEVIAVPYFDEPFQVYLKRQIDDDSLFNSSSPAINTFCHFMKNNSVDEYDKSMCEYNSNTTDYIICDCHSFGTFVSVASGNKAFYHEDTWIGMLFYNFGSISLFNIILFLVLFKGLAGKHGSKILDEKLNNTVYPIQSIRKVNND